MKRLAKDGKRAFCLTAAAALWLACSSVSAAADQAAPQGQPAEQHEETKLHKDRAASGGALTLSDMRDTAISLNQIAQEAINIYMEATRRHCNPGSPCKVEIPLSISEKSAAAFSKYKDLMPPRDQWIVYYIGTMEPIISLLTQDVKDSIAGVNELKVPADTRKEMLPLWDAWTAGIAGLNQELTEINSLLDSGKAENSALAKHAVAMYNWTVKLEQTREKAYTIIASSQKRNANEEEINLPGEH